jgi:hypothetical protein
MEGGVEGAAYVRFMARLYADRSPILEEVSARYLHVNGAYPGLLQRALPQRTLADLNLRLALANHAMLQTLADLTSARRPWLEPAEGMPGTAQIIAMLLDFISSGITGCPIPSRPQSHSPAPTRETTQ